MILCQSFWQIRREGERMVIIDRRTQLPKNEATQKNQEFSVDSSTSCSVGTRINKTRSQSPVLRIWGSTYPRTFGQPRRNPRTPQRSISSLSWLLQRVSIHRSSIIRCWISRIRSTLSHWTLMIQFIWLRSPKVQQLFHIRRRNKRKILFYLRRMSCGRKGNKHLIKTLLRIRKSFSRLLKRNR